MCSFFVLDANAQSSVTISGKVFDEKNETVPGANVYIKDKPGIGVVTDMDGVFKIKGNKNDFLVVSFIGYKNYEYQIAKNVADLEIHLEISSETIEETVVVGMGKQRKASVVGAVTSIEVKDLETPAASLNNVIGGKVPGIISVQNSGEPGKNISEFWIRGIGTFGANSSALVLIDGLEGSLDEVDPADIESFSVLKDASATAIYGVRGANGVVIIATKRGEEGKMKIAVRVNAALAYLKRKPQYLQAYEYAQLANEAAGVSGENPIYSPMEMDLIKYRLDPDLYPDVNWQDEILRDISWQKTIYTSLSGGGKVARYFISLGASNESAIYNQNSDSRYKQDIGYSTYNYRTNLDINITNTTKVYFGVDGFISKYQTPGLTNTNVLWNAQTRLTPLTVPLQYSSGEIPAYGPDNLITPYVLLNYTGYGIDEKYKNMVTMSLDQDFGKFIPGLTANAQGAFYNNSFFTEIRAKMPECYAAVGRSTTGALQLVKKVEEVPMSYGQTERQYRKYEFKSIVKYKHVFNEIHRVGGLLYYYMTSEKDSRASTSMGAIPKRYQGISGRATYSYRDTYHLDANFGYTGSENFQPGRQFGFFPSVAIGWTPTSYDYIKNKLPWLNFFKVRFSIGQVGNDKISNKRFLYLTIVEKQTGGWGRKQALVNLL